MKKGLRCLVVSKHHSLLISIGGSLPYTWGFQYCIVFLRSSQKKFDRKDKNASKGFRLNPFFKTKHNSTFANLSLLEPDFELSSQTGKTQEASELLCLVPTLRY